MARRAAGEDVVPPNVISLAQARAARQALFRWPADGPSAERVAVAALHAVPGEAALVAADGTILAVNRAWLLATPGAAPGVDVYAGWRLRDLDARDAAELIIGLRAALGGTDGFVHELDVDGRPARVVATSLGGSVGGAVVQVAQRDPRGDLGRGRDPLTGLADRGRFVDHVTRALGRDDGADVVVLLVDLHDFKLVNQAYGHAVGDELLVEVGRRLTTAAGYDDLVAHIGGDEFAVLSRSAPGSNEACVLAMAVAEQLAEPFTSGDHQVHLGASVGVRVADGGPADTSDAILCDAVAAMRDARHVPYGIAFFSDETRSRVRRRTTLEHDLRVAVEHGELSVAFQPQVDLRTGAVHGAEALVRWYHDDLGSVPPAEFVPIAEATGLIRPLGEWVLDQACRELARWRGAPGAPRFVTVNLSPLQLTGGGLVSVVGEALAAHGLAPDELCLELTESALLASPEQGIEALRALRSAGTSIALDDFGTGYSSLGRLKALPVDVVKLDRTFVVGLGSSEQDRAVVAAVMALTSALGLATVAEGVETEEQATHLLQLGCTVVQGWLYAPAVPGADFPTLCRNGFTPVATSQINDRRADQPSMETQEGHRHE
jgi:diguanylate cyclase (GGDEF)-like protein